MQQRITSVRGVGRMRPQTGISGWFAILRLVVGTWRQRARTRTALRDLDPRLLDDVGISAEAQAREAHKSFWRR